MISERLNQFGRITQGPDVQVTFRDLTGTTYVLPVKHIDYEVGFVRIQVGVIPKQMHDQESALRKAAQMALDTLNGLFPHDGYEGAVAVWRLGGSHAVNESIKALRKELGQ